MTSTAGAMVNFRTQPTTQSAVVGQGESGDRVEVLDQAEDADNYTWYFVNATGSSLTGWVRGDLLDLTAQPAPETPDESDFVPTSAIAACRNRALLELNAFTSDIVIRNARTAANGTYEMDWENTRTNQTGICRVNANAQEVAYFGDVEGENRPTVPGGLQTTLHNFRTDEYAVRLFQVESSDQPQQVYMNLFNIESQTSVLEGQPVQVAEAPSELIYWHIDGDREYQVRVRPNNSYRLRILQENGQVYESAAISGV
ncbi:MAG: SH3 domain-containing protein [Elainellaceae cyanobacterium]